MLRKKNKLYKKMRLTNRPKSPLASYLSEQNTQFGRFCIILDRTGGEFEYNVWETMLCISEEETTHEKKDYLYLINLLIDSSVSILTRRAAKTAIKIMPKKTFEIACHEISKKVNEFCKEETCLLITSIGKGNDSELIAFNLKDLPFSTRIKGVIRTLKHENIESLFSKE